MLAAELSCRIPRSPVLLRERTWAADRAVCGRARVGLYYGVPCRIDRFICRPDSRVRCSNNNKSHMCSLISVSRRSTSLIFATSLASETSASLTSNVPAHRFSQCPGASSKATDRNHSSPTKILSNIPSAIPTHLTCSGIADRALAWMISTGQMIICCPCVTPGLEGKNRKTECGESRH